MFIPLNGDLIDNRGGERIILAALVVMELLLKPLDKE
jgi:hypothetical protein